MPFHVYGFPVSSTPLPEQWPVMIDGIVQTTATSQIAAKAYADANFVSDNTQLDIFKLNLPVVNGTPSVLADGLADCAFASNFTSMDDHGEANCWGLCYAASDAIHGYLLTMMFKQGSDGTHTYRVKLLKTGIAVLDEEFDVTTDLNGNPSPVRILGNGDAVNFFISRDHACQAAWYNPPVDATGKDTFNINFQENVSLGDFPDFSITDEEMLFMPMEGSTSLTFAGLLVNCQLGQIYQTAGHIQTQYSQTAFPFAVRDLPDATNVTQTFVAAPHPGIEGLDFRMASP